MICRWSRTASALMSIGFLAEEDSAGHLARADAPQGARAVPHRRVLGRARLPARRPAARAPATSRSRSPSSCPRAEAAHRHHAAARRAAGRPAGGGDGAKTGMRVVGRGREHVVAPGTGHEVFGCRRRRGARGELGVPLLARIPLEPALRRGGRRGPPVARSVARRRGERGDPRPGGASPGTAAGRDPQGTDRPVGIKRSAVMVRRGRSRALPGGRPVAAFPCAARRRGLVGETRFPPRPNHGFPHVHPPRQQGREPGGSLP